MRFNKNVIFLASVILSCSEEKVDAKESFLVKKERIGIIFVDLFCCLMQKNVIIIRILIGVG
ncbi:MAG: hypothetical protein IKY22_09370 [Bacteroidales bacterium]|nr:hypothetical protein [Bacteroidales bacterium]